MNATILADAAPIIANSVSAICVCGNLTSSHDWITQTDSDLARVQANLTISAFDVCCTSCLVQEKKGMSHRQQMGSLKELIWICLANPLNEYL